MGAILVTNEQLAARQPYVECGCCGHYHRREWFGDCRDDAQRFAGSDLEDQHGDGWLDLVEDSARP